MISLARDGGEDWMASLDGTLALSQLSIPGTHNSGARYEVFSGTAKCQNLSITQQLEAGVRFLDIRCRHLNDAFVIYHGSVDQKLSFSAVLATTYAFLATNRGETVIMSIKEEHLASGNSRSFEECFDSYVAQNPDKWSLSPEIPTLDQSRGKIVLLRRFAARDTAKGIDASFWPDQTTFTFGALRVQDQYRVADTDVKWQKIATLLEEVRVGGACTLHINFASGYARGPLGVPNITKVSNQINQQLKEFFSAKRRGTFGTILVDFADTTLCELIYQTNFPVKRISNHEACKGQESP